MARALATAARLGGLLVRSSVARMFSVQSAGHGNDGQAALNSTTPSTVFVGGLAFSTNEDTLRESFSTYGEITDVKVIMDRMTGLSRGFGFVSFGSSAEADAALKGMDGQILDKRVIRVDLASSKPASATRREMGGEGMGGDHQRGYSSERQTYSQRGSSYDQDSYGNRSGYSPRGSGY